MKEDKKAGEKMSDSEKRREGSKLKIKEKEEKLAQMDSELAEKDSELAEKNAKIAELPIMVVAKNAIIFFIKFLN